MWEYLSLFRNGAKHRTTPSTAPFQNAGASRIKRSRQRCCARKRTLHDTTRDRLPCNHLTRGLFRHRFLGQRARAKTSAAIQHLGKNAPNPLLAIKSPRPKVDTASRPVLTPPTRYPLLSYRLLRLSACRAAPNLSRHPSMRILLSHEVNDLRRSQHFRSNVY
jgi:hypothetical protein